MYTPGQVLESTLGFDAAMMTHHIGFWNLWGRSTPSGLVPIPAWWPPRPQPLPSLPQFRLNLFLQYKRPQKLVRSNATEWSYWNNDYFRYDITSHQQSALEACANSLGQNGLVVYAAPAFISLTNLFQHTSNGTIVSATNFVEAAALNSHHRYTYTSAGNLGAAFSEPTEIKSFSMSEDLERRIHEAAEYPNRDNILQMADLAISEAMTTSWLKQDISSFNQMIEKTIVQLADFLPLRRGDSDVKKMKSFFRVSNFCNVSGWSWLVGGI